MSKHHHATRRRSYGRRQHDLHKRSTVRPVPWDEALDQSPEAALWLDERPAQDAAGGRSGLSDRS
jgi:hypothetical protein